MKKVERDTAGGESFHSKMIFSASSRAFAYADCDAKQSNKNGKTLPKVKTATAYFLRSMRHHLND